MVMIMNIIQATHGVRMSPPDSLPNITVNVVLGSERLANITAPLDVDIDHNRPHPQRRRRVK